MSAAKIHTNAHTTACGVEPIDKTFCIGPQKRYDYGGFSPYERIEKLRKIYKEHQLNLDSGRLLAFTEVYKNNQGLPVILKKAMAIKKYLEECTLSYIEGELLLTDDGSPCYSYPLYPEITTWIYEELRERPLYEREWDPIHYDDKMRDEILATEEFWKGRDIANTFRARLPQDAAKGCAAAGGMLVINPNVNVEFGIGHHTPDYERLLRMGIGGLREYIQGYKDKLGLPSNTEELHALQLYDAQLMVLDGWSTYFRRYAAFAKEQAGEYSSQQTKDELQSLSEICEHLAEGKPRNFWEAAQLCFALNNLIFMETNGHAIAMGRMDQFLYPFYQADMDNGTYSKDFMQEIIECYYLKLETHGNIAPESGDNTWRGGSRGWGGSALVLGGVDRDGKDATNDLTFMFLDAMLHVRLANPFITVRWHDGTPWELKVKVAEVVRMGIGHPKMFNDAVSKEALRRMGVTDEGDLNDYVNIGCVELEVPGATCGWHDCCYVTLPKVLELALNNGICMVTGMRLGPETGYLKDFKTFDEVLHAYETMLKYWADRAILTVNVLQEVHAECDDSPVTSLTCRGCIESGKSWQHGGAKYNFAGLQCLGPATTADSLTALKKLVFEEKKVTAEEYYDALVKNWEGHERLYMLVNSEKVPHYGNDDDYADAMMQYVFDSYSNLLQSYAPARGIHKIKTGSFSQVINLIFGQAVAATPDGRKAHEAISANIDPARTSISNRDRSGPTALAKSIGKLDHAKAGSGTLVNYKFGVETISGEKGRDTFIDFLDSYFDGGAMHVQFMVANRDTLIEAQRKPEEYRDLLVRVSGFSSYFHSLCKGFQDELINRTEQSFD